METDQDGIKVTPNEESNDGIVNKDKKDVVSHESFQTLLRQRKADQEKLRATEERLKRLDELEAKEASLVEQKHKDDGNWKALLESRESKLKDLETRNSELNGLVKGYEDKFTNAHKINAFKSAIGGSLKQKEYYSFVDVSKIALDPETGVIDDESLKNYANEFTNKFKDLIAFKTRKLPTEAGMTSMNVGKKIENMTTTELEAELRKLGNI